MPKNKLTTAFEKVNKIDLSLINKILQYENPTFWTENVLTETEASYRKFLVLNFLYPSETIVVNKILDDYWHQHILDTEKYADDCQKFFGYFLHHYPYFGINGEEDKQKNREGFASTQQLWEETFNSPMTNTTTLTLDKVLGIYDTNPREVDKNRIYAFPQACKNGQHCPKTIIPDPRIHPLINPKINPQINPQIRAPYMPRTQS